MNASSSRFWFWIDEDRPAPMIADIQRSAIECFGGTMRELLSESRRQRIILPRYVGMYLSRKLTQHSLHVIGSAFRRDHSLVVRAQEKITRDMVADPTFASQIAQIEAHFA